MIFHENSLLADDSHVILYLIFVENWENVAKFVCAAVVIGPLRVKDHNQKSKMFYRLHFRLSGLL